MLPTHKHAKTSEILDRVFDTAKSLILNGVGGIDRKRQFLEQDARDIKCLLSGLCGLSLYRLHHAIEFGFVVALHDDNTKRVADAFAFSCKVENRSTEVVEVERKQRFNRART